MKKTNKYRSNNNSNNNAIYSLNYKFDSNSIAGKVSGTALDLIKKYNEHAKDAQSNHDYVNAEIFRQYAEHYRKIVTDINERKNQRNAQEENKNAIVDNNSSSEEKITQPTEQIENKNIVESTTSENPEQKIEEAKPENKIKSKKSFKVIEISKIKNKKPNSEQTIENPEIKKEEMTEEIITTTKRTCRRKSAV